MYFSASFICSCWPPPFIIFEMCRLQMNDPWTDVPKSRSTWGEGKSTFPWSDVPKIRSTWGEGKPTFFPRKWRSNESIHVRRIQAGFLSQRSDGPKSQPISCEMRRALIPGKWPSYESILLRRSQDYFHSQRSDGPMSRSIWEVRAKR